ncbi:hypothetical protein BJV78DRAFT_721574 [Lactifluus subvellereus]|nr:hypothetical protein BJV78DRAFT_721574 [Lactifluus subvellereus]
MCRCVLRTGYSIPRRFLPIFLQWPIHHLALLLQFGYASGSLDSYSTSRVSFTPSCATFCAFCFSLAHSWFVSCWFTILRDSAANSCPGFVSPHH